VQAPPDLTKWVCRPYLIYQEDDMPIERLIFVILLAIAAAAATVVSVLALFGQQQSPPLVGLAILTLIALCASLGLRWFNDRKGDKNAGD
jgi:hypothetical protein